MQQSMTMPPRVGEFLDLTFSPAAADALSRLNGMVAHLRSIPDSLLTPELRDDRDRLLDKHLPDLLAAHRDARLTTGKGIDATADAELVEGLEHVGEEAERIRAAARAGANQTLATQSRFLETRYPVADDPLSVAEKPAADATPAPDPDAPARKLDRGSLESLFPKPKPGTPIAAKLNPKPPVRAADSWHWDAPNITGLIVGFACLILIFGAMGYALHRENEEAEIAKAFPAKVSVTAQIDSVRRDKHGDDDQGPAPVSIKLHGTIANRADREARQVLLAIDVFACPNGSAPARPSACKLLDTSEYYPTTDAVAPAGLTTRFQHVEQIRGIPDVDGSLRARVRLVGVSPFDAPQ